MSERTNWVDEAVRLYVEEKLSLNQVAEKVGKHQLTVRSRLLQAEVELRSPSGGRKSRPCWVGEAMRLYQEGYSTVQISNILRKDPSYIRTELLREGIKLRGRGEGREARNEREFVETLLPQWLSSAIAIRLLSYGLGDGSTSTGKRFKRNQYATKSSLLRDEVITWFESLGLSPLSFLRESTGVWQIKANTAHWYRFNRRLRDDTELLRKCALTYPADFVAGFLAAEGHHFITPTGLIELGADNTELTWLEILKDCFEALGLNAKVHGPFWTHGGYKTEYCTNPKPLYRLRVAQQKELNYEKAKFCTETLPMNKKLPSNYLLRRHLLRPEVQEIYDRTLEELYATYGKERVDRELLPAKRTKRM